MNFPQLQQRLRDAELDPFLVYDGRYNELNPTRDLYCRNALCVWPSKTGFRVTARQLDRPEQYPPDLTGPEPMKIYRESDINEYLWLHAVQASPARVRAVSPADLPVEVASAIERCGWAPAASLFGNPFVATKGIQSYRIALVGDTAELHLFDHSVPTLETPRAVGSLDEVCAALIDELERQLPPDPGAAALLVTDEIVDLAAKLRWTLRYVAATPMVELINGTTALALRVVADGYELSEHWMRPGDGDDIVYSTTATLEEPRAFMVNRMQAELARIRAMPLPTGYWPPPVHP
jgi:hypothetical protein